MKVRPVDSFAAYLLSPDPISVLSGEDRSDPSDAAKLLMSRKTPFYRPREDGDYSCCHSEAPTAAPCNCFNPLTIKIVFRKQH